MADDLFKKLEGIQACVFDAYGTLFNVASPVEKLASTIGEKASSVAQLWRLKQLEYTWLRSLMGTHMDFWNVTRDALDYTLEVNGVSEAGLADELMTLYLKLDAYEEVLLLCRRCGPKGNAARFYPMAVRPCWILLCAMQGSIKCLSRFYQLKRLAFINQAAGFTGWRCRRCKLPMRLRFVLCRPMHGMRKQRHSLGFRLCV